MRRKLRCRSGEACQRPSGVDVHRTFVGGARGANIALMVEVLAAGLAGIPAATLRLNGGSRRLRIVVIIAITRRKVRQRAAVNAKDSHRPYPLTIGAAA